MSGILEYLTEYIGQHGPIRAVRVTSVKVLGLTNCYQYWDSPRSLVIVYEGVPWHVQLDAEMPRHEQLQEAYRACAYIAQTEQRLIFERPLGPLRASDGEELYTLLACNTVGMPRPD